MCLWKAKATQGKFMWTTLPATVGRKLTPLGCKFEALDCLGGGCEKESFRDWRGDTQLGVGERNKTWFLVSGREMQTAATCCSPVASLQESL